MKVTSKDVQYVADLAHLELTDDERTRMERDLNSILDYIDRLNELGTSNVPPMAQVAQLSPIVGEHWREDQPRPSLERQQALRNAPQATDAFFRVPKVIER
ncbi:MAG TPA: Asp-tRNA(Asn)/Glu-tRNA(Gln) amidotransferase subunit GatC [Terriglobales bacterium]